LKAALKRNRNGGPPFGESGGQKHLVNLVITPARMRDQGGPLGLVGMGGGELAENTRRGRARHKGGG